MKKKLYYNHEELNFINYLNFFFLYKKWIYFILILSFTLALIINNFFIKSYNEYNFDITLNKHKFRLYINEDPNILDIHGITNFCLISKFCDFVNFGSINDYALQMLDETFLSEKFNKKVYNLLSFKNEFKNFKNYYNKIQQDSFIIKNRRFNIFFNHDLDFDEYKKIYLNSLEEIIDETASKQYVFAFKEGLNAYIKDFFIFYEDQCNDLNFSTILKCDLDFEFHLKNNDLTLSKNEIKLIQKKIDENHVLAYFNKVETYIDYENIYIILQIIYNINKISKIYNAGLENLSKDIMKNTRFIEANIQLKKENFKSINFMHIFLFSLVILIFMFILVVLLNNFNKPERYTLK